MKPKFIVWAAAFTILVIGAGMATGNLLFKDPDYSTTGKACRDFDVQPLQQLYGIRPAVVVEEKVAAGKVSCGYRIPVAGSGDATLNLGVALVTVVAQTFATREQARKQFEDRDEHYQDVAGIGEHARLLVVPVSSDAPEAMTHHSLGVLDHRLVLVVSLQALNLGAGIDQAAIRLALIDVAHSVMSDLD